MKEENLRFFFFVVYVAQIISGMFLKSISVFGDTDWLVYMNLKEHYLLTYLYKCEWIKLTFYSLSIQTFFLIVCQFERDCGHIWCHMSSVDTTTGQLLCGYSRNGSPISYTIMKVIPKIFFWACVEEEIGNKSVDSPWGNGMVRNFYGMSEMCFVLFGSWKCCPYPL